MPQKAAEGAKEDALNDIGPKFPLMAVQPSPKAATESWLVKSQKSTQFSIEPAAIWRLPVRKSRFNDQLGEAL
jgi:hypothetical protein